MILPDWFLVLHPIVQAFIAGLFTWGMTALGASLVFFTKQVSFKLLDSMMGFAAGVMIAASIWSLILPAIDMAEAQGHIGWIPAVIGFLLGGLILRICDHYLPHLHIGLPRDEAEGIPTSWRRSTLLMLAMTLHNIPEGLAIGVLFGAAIQSVDLGMSAALAPAIALAIGIGIQNFPEGVAVSLPLRRDGMETGKSFWYGQLSGIVEPVSAVIGAAAVILVQPLLPYALTFAAGAMIYVVVEELIPESHLSSTGFYKTPDLQWDRIKGKGRPFYYFAYGAAVSEVIVDTLTGEFKLLRSDILHDAGNSLNSAIDIGQIEGGFIQGMGWLTTEELVWDERGELKTHAPSTYKIPCASDRPKIFNVSLFDNLNVENTIYKSKAVGEPPFMLGISVFLALRNAVSACGNEWPILNAPATPENILRAVRRVNGT